MDYQITNGLIEVITHLKYSPYKAVKQQVKQAQIEKSSASFVQESLSTSYVCKSKNNDILY